MKQPTRKAASAPTTEERVLRANEADIPKLYANGFITGLTHGDVSIVLERNNIPVATVNLSYTVAKTLAIKLMTTIGTLESVSERPMLTTDEVDVALEKASAKKAAPTKERK